MIRRLFALTFALALGLPVAPPVAAASTSTGTLRMLHADALDPAKPIRDRVVLVGKGRVTTVRAGSLGGRALAKRINRKVNLTAIASAGSLLASAIADLGPADPPISQKYENLLVIGFSVKGEPPHPKWHMPIRSALEEALLGSGTNTLRSMMVTAAGKADLDLTYVRPTLELSPDLYCQDDGLRTLSDEALRLATKELGGPILPEVRIIYAFPPQSCLQWGGQTYYGGREIWLNGSILSPHTYLHELGHDWWSDHSNSLRFCSPDTSAELADCSSTEYGDPFSVMGSKNCTQKGSRWFSLPSGYDLYGWGLIPAPATVKTDGATTLSALYAPSPGLPRLMKVPLTTGTVWIEYRKSKQSLDRAWGDPYDTWGLYASRALDGVVVRWTPADVTGTATSRLPAPQLLDMRPVTQDCLDAPLQPGERLRLPDGRGYVALAKVSGRRAVVFVGAPPARIDAPTIEGSGLVGETLAIKYPATWSGAGLTAAGPTVSYRWQRKSAAGWTEIAGATAKTLVAPKELAGAYVRLAVTAKNPAGQASAVSNAIKIKVAAPVCAVAPSISGDPAVGSVLTLAAGSWTGPGPSTWSYEWQAQGFGDSWVAIAGATGITWTSTAGVAGRMIRVKVTVTNPGGSTSAYSAPFGPIAGVATPAPGSTASPSEPPTRGG